MKLKRNDLIELQKSGFKALVAKRTELKSLLVDSKLKVKRGEIGDLRIGRSIRRGIAQISTIITSIKELA